jgi:hypothetical protein
MKLGEFIEKFSHNNIIRLHHKIKGGHQCVSDDWGATSMDWEVNKGKGRNRHYIDNEVLGLLGIMFLGEDAPHSDAINIVIEKLENQPFIEEVKDEQRFHESIG